MEDKVYPVSEWFLSPQGEGQYCGAYMQFIRLAGCSVGKKYPADRYVKHDFPIYTEMCTTFDGREFPCDTNYQPNKKLKSSEIAALIPKDIEHVCITGGEPFNHNLEPLIWHIKELVSKNIQFHVETSGTVPLGKALPNIGWYNVGNIWVTVSPKKGVLDDMINRANEIKLLVDEEFDAAKLPESIHAHPLVYIQPINGENKIDPANMKVTMELQKKHPKWRISIQLHKAITASIGELVR